VFVWGAHTTAPPRAGNFPSTDYVKGEGNFAHERRVFATNSRQDNKKSFALEVSADPIGSRTLNAAHVGSRTLK